jgi:hypothetical protein
MCSLDEYNEILADDYMDPGKVCVLACPVASNKRTVRSKGDLVPRNIRHRRPKQLRDSQSGVN